jgi:CheY-like chemotaxis protein
MGMRIELRPAVSGPSFDFARIMTINRIDFSALDFLLIEENNFIRRLLREMLMGLGAERIREARSFETAMPDIDRLAPDIILCDWMMRPTDGLLFLRKLRADPAKPYAHALVIVIAEQASSDHIEAALGQGADSYIVKPFQSDTLLDHLVRGITGQQVHSVD